MDFLLFENNRVIQLINVTHILNNSNYKRETNGLIEVSCQLKCDNLLILTHGYKGIIEKMIRKLPRCPHGNG